MSDFTAVILAAGKGTRMKSALPKVLHSVGGKPMIGHVLTAAQKAGACRSIVVVGFGAQEVKDTIGSEAVFVVQKEQLGTGHAVMMTRDALADYSGTVMVLCGDTPLLTANLLCKLYDEHKTNKAAATVLTAIMPDPTGYGRVVRDSEGQVVKIVEQKDADPVELKIQEINTGIYCFESELLFKALNSINRQNVQGEYYLTDVIEILVADAAKVWATAAENAKETMGVNSRQQLAEAEKVLRNKKLEELMSDGVTIMDPCSTFVDADVVIGQDSILYPFTWLEGNTFIGANCEIGPNTRLQDTKVGKHVTLHYTYAHECIIEDDVIVGPYVHLRPNTVLSCGVKVGNFVEIKNSNVGEGSKVPHLSYIGDTDMGTHVNIGSGTITVNYDGKIKHRTSIGNEAFIGCNTNLVAPVTVGDNAYVGAGSTITKDVPKNALAVERAKQVNLDNWVLKNR